MYGMASLTCTGSSRLTEIFRGAVTAISTGAGSDGVAAGDLSSEVATLFNPLGAESVGGVTILETKPGDVVAVLGPGIQCTRRQKAGAGS